MTVANSSNITTIQILRSYSNTTPTTLDDGQLAYSFISNTLFIGSNTGIKVISNPPTDLRAQEAYNQANTATVLANAAYFHANGAFLKANAAFDNSNTKLSLSGGTITGPISGPGESKLDFTTYGPNTAYLTTTNDDSTALFMGTGSAELYADTNVQIRANTKGTSQNWTFSNDGSLTFPDNTIQTTAYVPNDEVDNVARAAVNAAYFHANGAFLKANAAFIQANVTVGVDATQNTRLTVSEGVDLSQNVRIDYSNTALTIAQGVDNSQNVRLDFSNTRMTIIEGVDVGQNTRMTVSDGVNASQNIRLDFSNTRMTIIEGVDVSQNARIAVSEGVDLSQNVRIDFSNTALTIAQGVDNSQNVRLDFSNTRMNIIDGVDAGQNSRMSISDGVNASQNVRLDFSNAAITIIQGVDVGQNNRMTIIEGTNASQNVRLDYSNTALTIAQGVDNSQNVRLDFSNTRMTIIDGVDVSQNSRMAIIEGTDVSQNARMTIIEGTDVSQNARMTISDGVNASQNVRLDFSNSRMTIIDGVDASQNARMTIIEGTDTSQNARMTISDGVNASQNVSIAAQNSFITIIQGVDVTQNTNIAATNQKMESAYAHANNANVTAKAAFDNSNTKLNLSGGTITGSLSIAQNLTVSGNLIIAGNTTSISANNLVINDPLIILANNNTTDIVDIGFIGHYNEISPGEFRHTGVIRHALDNEYYIFYNYDKHIHSNVGGNNIINVNDSSFLLSNVNAGNYKGNLIGQSVVVQTARVNGIDVINFSTAAFNAANTAQAKTDAAFAQANITIGVDATQNTRLTVIEGTDVSQNARMTISDGVDVTQNTRLTVSEGVDLSQNVRLDFSNTRMNIIDGVDAGQNARMTIIEGVDVGQNTRLTVSEGVDLSQNVSIFTQNCFITIIQGVDVGQNTRMSVIEGTDLSQNVRLDFSNNRMTIIEGVDVTQNTRLTVSEGVDLSQNVSINTQNSFITIIQGVDVGQNARIAVSEGVDLSQNVRLDYSNTALTIAQGVDNSQNVRLDYSNTVINQIQSAWTPNTVIVANSAGFLSNSGVFFTVSNNALITTGAVVAAGDISVATGQFVSVGGPGSGTRIRRDSSLNGLDLQTSSTSRLFIADADGSVNVRSTTSSTSNTTGALIVAGGIGTKGSIYSTGGSITINNGFATTGNSGTIFLGDGSVTKTFGSGFSFNSSVGAQYFVANAGSNSAAAFTFSGAGNLGIYSPFTGVVGITANSANALFVSAPASSVNYLNVSANTTGNAPTITSVGSDANVNLNLVTQGSGTFSFLNSNTTNGIVFRKNNVDNEWQVIANNTSNLGLVSTGGGSIYFYTATGGAQRQFAIATTSSAVNYLQVAGNAAGQQPYILSAGSDTNVGITYATKGTGPHFFSTGGGTLYQFEIFSSSSAVNYIRVTGAATGGTPYFIAAGSDSNIGVVYATKGSGSSSFWSQGGTALQFRISDTASAVNYLQATGNTTGGGAVLSAQGSDTNIDLVLFPKANGNVQIIGSSTVSRIYSRTFDNNYNTLIETNYDTNQGLNIYNTGSLVLRHGSAAGLILNYVNGNTNFQYRGTSQLSINGANNQVSILGPVRIQNTATSISNTTGALIVNGGLGLSGNLSMNLASSGAGVNRITLGPFNHITSAQNDGQVTFAGAGYYYFNAGILFNQNTLTQRGVINNDQGNTTVLFAGSSPVKIQNGTASSNTTTGALVVQGGVGISGALNATTKSFNIPHPTKVGKDLRYGSLEGPEFGVYVRGTLKGSNIIELPDYWTKLVDANTITVSLTPIGKHQKLSVKEVKDNTIIISSDGWFKKEIHCYYVVYGERADVDKLDVEG